MIPPVRLQLLGDFLLVAGDTPVTTITVPRVQSLLAYLVLHRSAPQDRSHLAFLLWPDSTEAQAHTNLRQVLYLLRQSLPDADKFLYSDNHSLQWLPAQPDVSFTVDIGEMEQALTRAEQAEQSLDTGTLRRALEQVMHLYRGDLLPSCYDEWIVPERERCHQTFLLAAERLIALLEEERAYTTAIAVARQLLRQDPLHEGTSRRLMRLLAVSGDRIAALRVYHTCVKLLERELGAEPDEATRTIYESLVQSGSSSKRRADSLTKRRTAAPLLGRKAEWRRLQEAWHKAADGRPHLVILSGEAGIGKTRLAEEMEAWVSRLGMTTVSARCFAAPGLLAYAPVSGWLRTDALKSGFSTLDETFLTEIARLAPEVLATRPHLPRPAAMTEGWQRQYFFEALARAVLSARQPLLLLLDDLHWCDHETLQWLQYLVRFDEKARVLLIGTVRAEETTPAHPLIAFLAALQRDGLVTELPLGPLTAAETASLAEHILDHQLDAATSNTLYCETEGNPLFVVEMVRAGTLEQRARAAADNKSSLPLLTHPTSTLPPVVQSTLAARLAELSPLAREVADVAAVIGREFAFTVLARASGEREDAVVRGLDELWQRRIVREQGEGTAEIYDFSHDKLREQVYASLGPAQRRLLHRRVATAIAEVYTSNLDVVSGQLAVHFERAGLAVQAILFYQRAGKVAMSIYAHTEAISAFERAAALLEAGPSGQVQQEQQWEIATQVYESLGDIFEVTGQLEEARQAYQHAMTSLPTGQSIWQARLQRKTARLWQFVSANPHDSSHVNAREAFQEAENMLQEASEQSSPAWQHEWIELQFAQIWPLRGSADDMTRVIEKTLPIVEQYGTQEQRELLTYAIATRDLMRARYVVSEQRLSFLRATVAALQQARNTSKKGTFHFEFGLALLWSGQLDEAEEQLGNALRVGEQLSIDWLQTRCLTFLPFIFRQRGQVEQVRSILTHAQATGATRNNHILMGHRAWVAWRDGNLIEAESYGRNSLGNGQQGPPVNAFLWTGLWPLIGVALAKEQIADAMNDVSMLLDLSQQLPPEPLGALLEAARHAWEAGEPEEACALLQQAVPLAQNMGYL